MLINFNKLLNFKAINYCNRLLHRYIFKMDKAYLRHLNDSEQFQITFHYANPELKVDRQFNFCRQLKEDVNTFLNRVSVNVEKVVNKKNKKKKSSQDADTNTTPINARLVLNGAEIDGDIICREIFKLEFNSNVILKVLEQEYNIVINSPWVDGVTLPSSILANFPVYPSKFETVFTEKDLSEFIWYKSENKVDWKQIGSGFVFMPKNEDINSYLKINCIPRNKTSVGPIAEAISDVKVEASPGFCPFENRHQFTKQRASGKE